ncbi:MAG: UDP-N-acetylmuramoyl-L-alanine--D-glutamate ligase [PVC group bacterium]
MNGIMEIKGKKALVLGLGLSGEAAAELLLKEGASVTVIDDGAGPLLQERGARLSEMGAKVVLGRGGTGAAGSFDLAVLSPGIPPSHPALVRAREMGIPVAGEVELAARFLPGPVIAVTGTNGKTTTVSLIVEMFLRAGLPAVAAGNIGYPLSRVALEKKTGLTVVAEISSFQLEGAGFFRPGTAVFLNLDPDHLDRYPEMSDYLAAKLRIFRDQGPGDRAVMPERLLPLLGKAVPGGVEIRTWGGREGMVREEGGSIWLVRPAGRERICKESEILLRGPHNRENVMAAAAAAVLAGLPAGEVGAAVRSFRGLPHRLEYVADIAGVRFYNDSKVTNPGAVRAALKSFDRPVIWLAGGSDKNLDFSPLGPLLGRAVTLALLMGESREKLRCLVDGRVPFLTVSGLEEAVSEAFRRSGPGDVVLLSPGCASFDMFADYRERGDRFKEIVGKMSVQAVQTAQTVKTA